MAIERYDSPTFGRQLFGGRGAVTSAATNVIYANKYPARLIAAHCVVAVAGTSTAANNSQYALMIGTGSVGVFTMGTNAIGVSSSLGSKDSPIGTATAWQAFSAVKNGGADGQVDIVYEFEVLPTASLA